MWRNVDVTFIDQESGSRATLPCPVTVRTPPHRWQYASLSSEPSLEVSSGFVALRIATFVNDGPIGIGLVCPRNISRYVVPERILNRSASEQEIVFLLPAEQRFRVCVRTGDSDHPADARILDVSWTNDPKVIKEGQAARFSHWHYTTDLGDGVVVHATVHDEPGWTRANAVTRAIIRYLLKEYVGPVEGFKVLDVACSAGHFSFLFALMGADVHGFDHDSKAIEQAQFIASQLQQEWSGSTNFTVANLENFGLDEQYDLVFCSGLFYHLKDPIGGAQRLERLTHRWLLIQSCVCTRQDPVFELSDPLRWPFCADWEFCLVPSAAMVQAVFEKLGLRLRASFRLGDFMVDAKATSVKIRPAPDCEPERIARLGDPVYLVFEKFTDASA